MSLLSDSYISYVNLSHRTDRLERMKVQLERVGIDAIRTPGIYPHERLEDKSKMTAMLNRKQVGALGCYLAQVDIMKKALELDKHAFIIEDDIVFCEDFNERIDYIDKWQSIKSEDGIKTAIDWSIVWLGGTFHVGRPYWDEKRKPEHRIGRDAELTNDKHMVRTFGSFCTYSYIVNKDSIQKVLDLLESFISESIGIDHSMINISPKLNNTYAFVPGCCKQIDNASDQHEGAYTAFSKFEKLNGTIENSAYWYQNKMSDFDPTTFDWKEVKTQDREWLKK